MSMGNTSESKLMRLIYLAESWANVADNTSSSPLTQIALGLYTADPGEAGTMSTNEIGYTSYARQNVSRSGSGWTESGGTVNLASNLDFPAGTGGGGTATYFATGKTGGGATDILVSGTVTPGIVCGDGVTPRLTTATAITCD